MTMLAEQVSVHRVENGWVLNVTCGGSNLMLVAKSTDEVAGFIKGMEWQTPRPLPVSDWRDAPPVPPPPGPGFIGGATLQPTTR